MNDLKTFEAHLTTPLAEVRTGIIKRISELDPDDVLAHTSLSILYQKKGMIPEAEAEANRARVLGWKQQLKQPKSG